MKKTLAGFKAEDLLIPAGIIWLIYHIVSTPYSPCHDALDLHTILGYMLRGERIEILNQAYINFWVNNKLTLYCYFPLVRLFNNVTAGVRASNILFLSGMVFFSALSLDKISENHRFSFNFFIAALLAPFLLLTGPYIYLPSLFIASAALYCLVSRAKAGLALFVFFSAILFVLRPTCAGFILAFLAFTALFNFKRKKYFLTRILLIVCIFTCGLFAKTALGFLMYKTGAHIYSDMQNSAMLWTIELGTRPNGKDTGSCTYNPYAVPENCDSVQRDFNDLWMYYYNDVLYGTSSAAEIRETHEKIKAQIKTRLSELGIKGMIRNMYHKTRRFYENDYIPYYYKANVNNKSLNLGINYDKKYFAYLNGILILFFTAFIINACLFVKNRKIKNKYALALALAALAVNFMMIALTEVSKKYLFDFFLPMLLCICITCSYIRVKNIRIKMLCAAVIAAAAAVSSRQWNVRPFQRSDTSLTRSGNMCEYRISMRSPCYDTGYYIEEDGGTIIRLYGKQEVTLSFPYDCFYAFQLHYPDGTKQSFSSQPIN